MLAALWSVTSWRWKVIKMFLIPSWSLWLYNLLYLLAKISILKTRMILQLLIVRPSIYFVSKFCLFILFESFIWLIVYFYFHYIVYVFSWISMDFNTSMLSCASNVIPQCRRRWQPFFERAKFCSKSITSAKPPYLCRDHGFRSCFSIFPFFYP